MEWFRVRHEEAARFAAAAEAHLTGHPTVCADSCGLISLSGDDGFTTKL